MQRRQPVQGLYGHVPADLVAVPAGAVQFSPLVPGSSSLEAAGLILSSMIVAAPPGTLERRRILALALRCLAPGAPLTVMAPKDKGGLRIAKELAGFGCAVGETARRHVRICETVRPEGEAGIAEALTEGGPRRDPGLGLWTEPGVFSWDRIDPGSALLKEHLPPLSGRGADLGCGIGVLGLAVLASPDVTNLVLIDIDWRAVEAARRNMEDPRAALRWADVGSPAPDLAGLDFVVMNPPFHHEGVEDRTLGQGFIRRAHEILRPGGVLWLTANRHLPYEEVLRTLFKVVTPRAESGGYKIFEARR